VHASPRVANGFPNTLYVGLPNEIVQQAEVIQIHENANVRDIGIGEAIHRKYRRLKHGVGQAYDRLSD
jgi:hypothetical protein